ncbi:MAG: C40 family peptidase [Eubacteriales bacterium]|nr:C40 family peptidase [Eubacteriales bacterium]
MRKKSLSILAAGVVMLSVMGTVPVSAAEFIGPVQEDTADVFTDGEENENGGLNQIATQLAEQTEERAQQYFDDRENAEKIVEARKKAEEELKKAEEERKKAEEERKKAEEARKKAEEVQKKAVEAEEERLAKRQEIVNFALQFEGNPYVYGGTSLTNGADCSGFVMSVFKEFGYELPRVAAAQCEAATQKDISQIEPGDLVFYGANGIDHVALYIGDGKIIHASTAATGIKISDYNYNTPVAVGTYLE